MTSSLDSQQDSPFTLAVTTIASPTQAMRAHAESASDQGAHIVVAGDLKGPEAFDLPSTTFLSLDAQRHFSELGQKLPTSTYTRKNIAYLWAIASGATVIVETDDDNAPLSSFYRERSREVLAKKIESPGWINVYSCFSDSGVWPRGLPLEHVNSAACNFSEDQPVTISTPIQQGLADGDPDVDAVYRMTRPLPVYFESDRAVALAPGTWSPFNSQNTTWFPEAYALMYLPSFCSFRMTDIWRSFVAQRIAWANDWWIAFKSPDVLQERNEHNLLADFSDEVPGYLNNHKIARALEEVEVPRGELASALVACYERLIEMEVVGADELRLLELWLQEVEAHSRTGGFSR